MISMHKSIILAGFAILGLGLLFEPPKAYALECPSQNDLKTSPLAADIVKFVPKGLQLKDPDRLNAAIDLLMEHGLSADDTINHLVAYYCPGVAAETGLSNHRKIKEVRRFANLATKVVASRIHVEDVIYDVPLHPTTADAVELRARNAGITPKAWIAQTVQSALKRDGTAIPSNTSR
jgi:hypothetical protein